MGDTLKDIPEFFETELGECVTSRTLALATCRELGPPDLCHVIKTNSKPGVKELGSYHYLLGLEASSSATLAAYLNSLTYLMEVPQGWFNKAPVWRVRSGIYCCYNAFSRVDVRVEVKIPGGVEAYIVNSKAEKLPLKDEIWVETYISAVLRSLSFSDDLTYRLDGLRYMNPIPDFDAEVRFFEAVELLFWRGYLLGAEADLQFANHIYNYLTDGIMKYLVNSGRYHTGINLFVKSASDPEVNALLSSCYLETDQELMAVQALCDGLVEKPSSYGLLLAQADFLIQKGRLDMAITLARRAVNVAPSEFRTWIKLAEIYVILKDYKAALLTLNSCPMFALGERELPQMPEPQRSHFPPKHGDILAYGLDDDPERQDEVPTALSRLPGNTLRGTFAKAYKLLTLVASKVGWDELLRFRSSSFVMEEEYRLQKSQEEKPLANSRRTPRSELARSLTPASLQQQTSSDATNPSSLTFPTDLSAPNLVKENAYEANADGDKDHDEIVNQQSDSEVAAEGDDVQTDKVDDIKEEHEEEFNDVSLVPQPQTNANEDDAEVEDGLQELSLDESKVSESTIPIKSPTHPENLQHSNLVSIKTENEGSMEEATKVEMDRSNASTPRLDSAMSVATATFQHKRLCERWLDNLFMVLYEDLRAFTSWRSEMAGTRTQRLTYRYSGFEWESLGDLCLRLHRNEEAFDAYTNCVHHKFSARAWAYLLDQHTLDNNNLQLTVGALIRLAMYYEKIYNECQIPSHVMRSVKQMIAVHGLAKIQNLMLALDLSPEVVKVVNRYLDLAISFKMSGTIES